MEDKLKKRKIKENEKTDGKPKPKLTKKNTVEVKKEKPDSKMKSLEISDDAINFGSTTIKCRVCERIFGLNSAYEKHRCGTGESQRTVKSEVNEAVAGPSRIASVLSSAARKPNESASVNPAGTSGQGNFLKFVKPEKVDDGGPIPRIDVVRSCSGEEAMQLNIDSEQTIPPVPLDGAANADSRISATPAAGPSASAAMPNEMANYGYFEFLRAKMERLEQDLQIIKQDNQIIKQDNQVIKHTVTMLVLKTT